MQLALLDERATSIDLHVSDTAMRGNLLHQRADASSDLSMQADLEKEERKATIEARRAN